MGLFAQLGNGPRHLAWLLLASCTDGGVGPPGVLRLEVVTPSPLYGLIAERTPDSVTVRVTDAFGAGVSGAEVFFAAVPGDGAMLPATRRTDADGYARSAWFLPGKAGEFRGVVRAKGPFLLDSENPIESGVRAEGVVVENSATASMLRELWYEIWSVAHRMEGDIARNPTNADAMRSRIALLRTPGLASSILEHRRYVEGTADLSVTSCPLTAVYALDSMRSGAERSIAIIPGLLATLEDFMGPVPICEVWLWYGFSTGNSTGGRSIRMVDRATYDSLPGTPLPYDAVLAHELGHRYFAHERLTQFLEVLVYNVWLTGSRDLADWPHTRDFPDNEGVHALMDVYGMIGWDAMSAGYRAIDGVADWRERFIAHVPESMRDAVMPKLNAVIP